MSKTMKHTKEWTGPVRTEGSWGASKPVQCRCRLTLYVDDRGIPAYMELEAGEDFAEIGLDFNNGIVDGFDGVMSFPPQAVELLESLGYSVDPYLKD